MSHRWSTTLLFGLACFYAGGAAEVQIYKAQDARAVEARLREVFCEQAVWHGLLTTCYATRLPPPMPPAELDASVRQARG